MRLILSPRAEKQFKKLPRVTQIILAKKIRSLIRSSTIKGEEKLKGHRNIYRVRVENYRVVYKKTKKEVYVVLIGHCLANPYEN